MERFLRHRAPQKNNFLVIASSESCDMLENIRSYKDIFSKIFDFKYTQKLGKKPQRGCKDTKPNLAVILDLYGKPGIKFTVGARVPREY